MFTNATDVKTDIKTVIDSMDSIVARMQALRGKK